MLVLRKIVPLHAVFRPYRAFSVAGSGFALFSPRKLDSLMKLEMLSNLSQDEIKEIWKNSQGLKQIGGLLCGDIDPAVDTVLRERAKKCPMFITFAFKSPEAYVTLLSQFQENFFMLTYLEEYRRNPLNARPWMQFTLYNDLLASKSLCLYRTEFTPDLTKAESASLTASLLRLYTDDEVFANHVTKFNKNPDMFKFDEYLKLSSRWYVDEKARQETETRNHDQE